MKPQNFLVALMLVFNVGVIWYANHVITTAHERVREVEQDLREAQRRAVLGERANDSADSVQVRHSPPPATPKITGVTDAPSPAPASRGTELAIDAATDDLAANAQARDAIRARMQHRYVLARDRDARRYSARELETIDRLYQDGLGAIDTPQGRDSLQALISQFPDANRSGCAAMNLGAAYLNEGHYDDARRYLELVVNNNSTAYFQNGESVLAKALFNYGMLMQESGNDEAAAAAWQRIVDELADETDGHGAAYGSLAAERLHH